MTWYKDGRPPKGTATESAQTVPSVTTVGGVKLETEAQARGRILALRGTPYKKGRSSANGASCAGFVALALRRFGIGAPESSVKALWGFGRAISLAQVRLGDVLFFANSPSRKRPDFAGIAISSKEMFYMSVKGGRARIQNISNSWWKSIFVGGRRVIERRSSGHYVVKPKPSDADSKGNSQRQRGLASFYGREANSEWTASGERFQPSALTAAHRTLPMESMVKVTNLRNGRSIVVRINDRGPYIDGRIIDLTKTGARKLNMVSSGVVQVELQVLRYGDGSR